MPDVQIVRKTIDQLDRIKTEQIDPDLDLLLYFDASAPIDQRTKTIVLRDIRAFITEGLSVNSSSGTGTAATWGNITGTIASQADLQAALSGKQSVHDELTGLAGLSATGVIRRTGVGAYTAGTIAASDIPASAIDNGKVSATAAIAWSKISKAGAAANDVGAASSSITIGGVNSIGGGGDLTANRSLSLVNDMALPGNSKYYGTNASGVRGFFDLPAGGGGGAAWGSVTGTLSNQTDLQTALNGKQASSNELTAIGGLSATGFVRRTGAATYAASSIAASDIPNLDANKITTGTIAAARIPDLSATYQILSNYLTDIIGGFGGAGNGQVVRKKLDGTGLEYATVTAGSGAAWGSITGSIASQSDLQSILNGKQANSLELSGIAGLTATGVMKRLDWGVYSAAALTAADIPNLDASKITTGTIAAARIPDLSATYATAAQGTLAASALQSSALSSTTPLSNVTNGAIGSATTIARSDHQHPISGDLGGATLVNFIASINPQTATTYTIAATDNGRIIELGNASAIAVTLPNSLPAGFNCTIAQVSTGQITLSPTAGATIRHPDGHTKTAKQWAMGTLYVRSNASGTAAEWVWGGYTA